MEGIIVATGLVTLVAEILSFVWASDADSPLGDGMALGCLLMAVPLWPITMPLWLLYLIKRHADQRHYR
jgi:hypothetical protein